MHHTTTPSFSKHTDLYLFPSPESWGKGARRRLGHVRACVRQTLSARLQMALGGGSPVTGISRRSLLPAMTVTVLSASRPSRMILGGSGIYSAQRLSPHTISTYCILASDRLLINMGNNQFSTWLKVCMYVCVYLYAYICTYTYIYTSMNICVYIYESSQLLVLGTLNCFLLDL